MESLEMKTSSKGASGYGHKADADNLKKMVEQFQNDDSADMDGIKPMNLPSHIRLVAMPGG